MILIDAAKIDVNKWFTDLSDIRRINAMLKEAARHTYRMKIADVLENMLCSGDVEIAADEFEEKELRNLEAFNGTQTLKQQLENITPNPKIKLKHLHNGHDALIGSPRDILSFVRKHMADYDYESILVDEEGNVRFYLN